MKRTLFIVVIAGLLAGSIPMFAHHGSAISYDMAKPDSAGFDDRA